MDTKRNDNPDQSEELIPVFIPALAALLHRAEQLKDAPLTEDEVLRIRDKGVCMMLERPAADVLEQRRGYKDIDPERCWEQWQQLKAQITQSDE